MLYVGLFTMVTAPSVHSSMKNQGCGSIRYVYSSITYVVCGSINFDLSMIIHM